MWLLQSAAAGNARSRRGAAWRAEAVEDQKAEALSACLPRRGGSSVSARMSRTERTYYLVFGLYNLSWAFIGGMYALFLLARGLDLFQMSIVPAVFWIVSFFLEVPTGAFADLAGRKTSFVLSCFVRMLAFGLYAAAGSFTAFIVAEFVDAVGATLANGALEAWAVDTRSAPGS